MPKRDAPMWDPLRLGGFMMRVLPG
jgi:hypothetical protein